VYVIDFFFKSVISLIETCYERCAIEGHLKATQ